MLAIFVDITRCGCSIPISGGTKSATRDEPLGFPPEILREIDWKTKHAENQFIPTFALFIYVIVMLLLGWLSMCKCACKMPCWCLLFNSARESLLQS